MQQLHLVVVLCRLSLWTGLGSGAAWRRLQWRGVWRGLPTLGPRPSGRLLQTRR